MVKDLRKLKQQRLNIIQGKNGNCLTEDDIMQNWREYCSNLYNYENRRDPYVTKNEESSNDDGAPIFREVETAIKTMKNAKMTGIGTIPAELINNGGASVIDIVRIICNKIQQTGEWSTL